MKSNTLPLLHSSFVSTYIFINFLLTQTEAQGTWNNQYDTADAGSSSSSGIDIPTQAIIAMCTVVGVVCIIGVTSAILYLVAKKRQWTMSETIRRSARRVSKIIWTPPSLEMSKVVIPLKEVQLMSDDEIRQPAFDKNLDLESGMKHNDVMTTVSSNRGRTESESTRGRPRSWGSFFSFRRP